MSENSENTKTTETSPPIIDDDDVEKQQNGAKTNNAVPQDVATLTTVVVWDNNNHFFEEKVKERAPPGIHGSVIFLYSLFFAMFVIGWVHLNRCPLNQLIPVYLIIAGSLGAVTKYMSKYPNKCCFWTTIALIVFDIFWHGVGSYIVYKEYQPSYNWKDPLYCNRTTYLVAFWTLTIEYTILLFFILLSCCYMLMRRDFRSPD